MRTRICSKCKVEKNFDVDFHRNRSMPGGRHPYCRSCKNIADKKSRLADPKRSDTARERSRAYYHNNKEERLVYIRKYQYNKKVKAIQVLGGKCQRCGFDHPAALQFHHRDPAAKSFNLSSKELSTPRQFPWEEILKEIEKCDLLCANCHAVEHSKWDHAGGLE